MGNLAIPYPLGILDCGPRSIAGQTDCTSLMDHRIVITYFVVAKAFIRQNAGSLQFLANDFSGAHLKPFVHYYFGHSPRSGESCHHLPICILLYRQLVYYLKLSSSPNSSFSFYSHPGAYATCSATRLDL